MWLFIGIVLWNKIIALVGLEPSFLISAIVVIGFHLAVYCLIGKLLGAKGVAIMFAVDLVFMALLKSVSK